MVQEVQTGIGITNETTLETIEAIGTSSFKIREGRQTTPRYLSAVYGSGYVHRTYLGDGNRDSGMKVGTITITNMVGKSEYKEQSGGIRVPFAGTYKIEFSGNYGSSTAETTLYLIRGTSAGDQVLWTKYYGSYGNKETNTIEVDLGKFDIITLWASWHYTYTETAVSSQAETMDITITQL